jgi:hypothetical protein
MRGKGCQCTRMRLLVLKVQLPGPGPFQLHCSVLEMHLGGDRGAVARGGRGLGLAQGNLTLHWQVLTLNRLTVTLPPLRGCPSRVPFKFVWVVPLLKLLPQAPNRDILGGSAATGRAGLRGYIVVSKFAYIRAYVLVAA